MRLLKRITAKGSHDTGGDYTQKLRESVRAVLFDENNLVAVLYIGKYDFYTLPGGGIDEGETVEEALTREMLEETGCACEILNALGRIEEDSIQSDWQPGVSYCFLAKVIGQKGVPKLTQMESEEETQVQWHNLHEAQRLIETQCVAEDNRIEKMVQERDTTMLKEAVRVLNG